MSMTLYNYSLCMAYNEGNISIFESYGKLILLREWENIQCYRDICIGIDTLYCYRDICIGIEICVLV